MSEKSLTPRIRFKGFADAWEQRKLGDVLSYEQPQEYIVSTKILDEETATPVLTAGQSFVLGYTNETAGIKEASADNPVIIFDDFMTTSHYVDFNFKIKSSAMKLLDAKTEDDDFYFSYMLLKSIDYEVQNHERHWISKFSQFTVNVPSSDEQSRIGLLFKSIDTIITLHQRKLDKLVQLKSSFLEKMFPTNGCNKPQIRFKGFSDAWEQRKLGEVGNCKSGVGFPNSEQGGEVGIPFYKVSDMNLPGNEKTLITANNYVSNDQIIRHGWKVIESPAIFFAKVGAAVLLNRKRLVLHDFLLDNNTMAYVYVPEKWNADYLYSAFERIDLTSLVQVGALPSYNGTQVEQVEIMVPCINEQMYIGKMFSYIDNIITLHQRKLEMLKNLKSSLLEKMFV